MKSTPPPLLPHPESFHPHILKYILRNISDNAVLGKSTLQLYHYRDGSVLISHTQLSGLLLNAIPRYHAILIWKNIV